MACSVRFVSSLAAVPIFSQLLSNLSRQFGIAEATFYVWRKKYAGLGPIEVRELRQLREENARLKKLVADLTLDKHILTEVVQKKL